LYECQQEWTLIFTLDYFNFNVLSLITLPNFFTCIHYAISKLFVTRANDDNYYVSVGPEYQGLNEALFSKLNYEKYDQAKKVQTLDCAICLRLYEQADDIVALPCHASHYFHAQCIEDWLKFKD